ncbi:unnamed protein product [Cuscuta campestris]|uniref:DUF7950 domain-containing protein n=1 Tax=Cuscuta campestris TaxID=132261 RepID=A0A484MZ31_9ASTE|nr:unnamed protein product [Cuscuta campestris]
MNLARDTCPGFLSDGLNRVTWANAAYREMVGHSGGGAVVVGEGVEVPPITAAAFTCRVRVVTCGGKCRVLWCDVWRMDGGGFAWRLDTEVALTLGLDNKHPKQTALQTNCF